MQILYKNDRNVKFVLFTKTSNECKSIAQSYLTTGEEITP